MESFQNDSSQPCVCIGSKLRLLSQLKVRYEGTLHSVDTSKSTISLKNVKTYGTEGRSVDGSEIPGSEEVFDVIVFRASDISEIFMIEAPTAVSVDPAIVDYQQTREKQTTATAVQPQRDFPPGHNVTSGPESVQSGGDHAQRHDVGHVGAKAVNKGWGTENRREGNDRDHQAWGPSHRGAQFERRPAPTDVRRDRDSYGERNGPYSAVERKLPANNGNARPYPSQQHGGRSAGYGYNSDGGSRQMSARQPGYGYGGQQGGPHYGAEEHRSGGYRQGGENGGRAGWREQRDRPEYQRGGRDGVGQRGYYNQREGGDDRHQAVPQQHRRQQYVNAREPQQSQHGRGPLAQRKDRPQQGGQRSRDRENQHDRDPQSAGNAKNVPEFDFEKANEEFSKLDLNQAASAVGEKAEKAEATEASGSAVEANENKEGTASNEPTEPTYLKDSFFDDISRDSRQAQRPKTSERSLNMQTFGAAATRRRPATGRYYNRRPGNWTGSGNANGGEASTNATAQVSA